MKFEVVGKPVPKGRPRFTRKGVAYTPDQTKAFEKHMNLSARGSKARCGGAPCIVFVTSVFEAPASWSKSRREKAENGLVAMTSKPDIDNLVKAALDGAQGEGAAFDDDRQVIAVVGMKRYGKEAKTLVEVYPVEVDGADLRADEIGSPALRGLVWKLLLGKEKL